MSVNSKVYLTDKQIRKNSAPRFGLSLILDQIFAILVSLAFFIVIDSFSETAATAISTVISTGFFLVIVYNEGVRYGSRDRNLLVLHDEKPQLLKALIASGYASAPGVLLALLATFAPSGTPVMNITNEVAYGFYYYPFSLILPTIIANSWTHFLPVLFVPIFANIGYFDGLFRFFIGKRKQTDRVSTTGSRSF